MSAHDPTRAALEHDAAAIARAHRATTAEPSHARSAVLFAVALVADLRRRGRPTTRARCALELLTRVLEDAREDDDGDGE